MAYTYEELKKMTVAELREMAAGLDHEAVQGYTQLNKEHLLPALCKALGIEGYEHHAAAVNAEKMMIKAKMRELKVAAEKARLGGDHEKMHELRRAHHHLNHALRTSAKREMLRH